MAQESVEEFEQPVIISNRDLIEKLHEKLVCNLVYLAKGYILQL